MYMLGSKHGLDNPWIALLKAWIHALSNNPWIARSIHGSPLDRRVQSMDLDNPWIALLKAWIQALSNNPWIARSIHGSPLPPKGAKHRFGQSMHGFGQSMESRIDLDKVWISSSSCCDNQSGRYMGFHKKNSRTYHLSCQESLSYKHSLQDHVAILFLERTCY